MIVGPRSHLRLALQVALAYDAAYEVLDPFYALAGLLPPVECLAYLRNVPQS